MTATKNGLDALTAARWLFGSTATSFRFLAVGDHFMFPSVRTPGGPVGPVFTKTAANGWYQDATTGRRFRTGGGSAVVPVTRGGQ